MQELHEYINNQKRKKQKAEIVNSDFDNVMFIPKKKYLEDNQNNNNGFWDGFNK